MRDQIKLLEKENRRLSVQLEIKGKAIWDLKDSLEGQGIYPFCDLRGNEEKIVVICKKDYKSKFEKLKEMVLRLPE